MNLIAYLKKETPLAVKIANADSFDLNKIKNQIEELEKNNVVGYVILADFTTMAAHIIPTEMTEKPVKVAAMMIGDKYFKTFADVKSEIMTANDVVARVNKWINNWDKLKGKQNFWPAPILRLQKGFFWATTKHQTVPREFIDEIEADVK